MASMRENAGIPFELPPGWVYDLFSGGKKVVEAHDPESGEFLGAVTVDERIRGFDLGVAHVKKSGGYMGKGWKERLYQDAIDCLKGTF